MSTPQKASSGTTVAGDALVLALDRSGVDVQVPRAADIVFGRDSSNHVDKARWVVTVAFAGGLSPGPADSQQLIGARRRSRAGYRPVGEGRSQRGGGDAGRVEMAELYAQLRVQRSDPDP